MTKLPDFKAMYRDMARGMGNRVRCDICGREETVDPGYCLRHGWPQCHGYTMRLLTPGAGGHEG